MSLFFGGKGKEEDGQGPKPLSRHAHRGHARYVQRQQRKSRERGGRQSFKARQRAETLEAQRRILMGEVDVPDAVRRNVERAIETQARREGVDLDA